MSTKSSDKNTEFLIFHYSVHQNTENTITATFLYVFILANFWFLLALINQASSPAFHVYTCTSQMFNWLLGLGHPFIAWLRCVFYFVPRVVLLCACEELQWQSRSQMNTGKSGVISDTGEGCRAGVRVPSSLQCGINSFRKLLPALFPREFFHVCIVND